MSHPTPGCAQTQSASGSAVLRLNTMLLAVLCQRRASYVSPVQLCFAQVLQ